jgi:hypothetical protein
MNSWLKRFLVGAALLAALTIPLMATQGPPSYPAYQWHTFLGGDENVAANKPATVTDADGNLYITGSTTYPWDSAGNPGPRTRTYVAYLAKISPAGEIVWSSFFPTPASNRWDGVRPVAITLDPAGNIYIAGPGMIDPYGCSNCGNFVLETNSQGVYLGGANFGAPTDSTIGQTQVYGMTYNAADHHVYITGANTVGWFGPGQPVINSPGRSTIFVLQVNDLAQGKGVGWLGFYYSTYVPFNDWVWGAAITADSSSNLYIAGTDGNHVAVWKISNTGQWLWENIYGWGNSYAVVADGANVYVTGFSGSGWNGPGTQAPLNAFSYGNLTAGAEAFVLKVDTGGNYIWHTFYNGNWAQTIGEGIALDGPTKVYVTGPGDLQGFNGAAPLNNGTGGHFILQLDDAGAYQWHSLYGVAQYDEASSVAVDPQHNVFVSGWTGWATWNGDNNTPPLHPASGYASEIFVMKFGAVKATPVITWANPADIVYGTALGPQQLSPSANVPGTWTYNPAQGTVLTAGANQTLSTTFTPTDANLYNTATKSVQINVSKATPVITWAAPAAITYGGALGNGQLNASANVPGTFVYTPPAGTVLKVGNGQTLSAILTPADTADYTSASASTTINVNAAPPPPSGVNLVVTKVLTRSGGNVVVLLTIANTGGTAANNVTLTSVKVGSVTPTPLPKTVGNIGPGAVAQATFSVPGSVGNPGAASTLTAAGTYAGGTFSLSMRITLP